VDDLKKYVEVLNKLMRRCGAVSSIYNRHVSIYFRYKYLQKPLEESALPGILQYIHRWPASQQDKLAIATGLLISQGLASASCLQSLTKDHLVKNGNYRYFQSLSALMPSFTDVSVNVVTLIFRSFLVDQSMDHLASALKKAGIKDLPAFFPPNKRDGKVIDEHFKKAGLPQVAEWWAKKQYAVVKEGIVKDLQEMSEHDESTEQVRRATMYPHESNRVGIDPRFHQISPRGTTPPRNRTCSMHLASIYDFRRLGRAT
jgi:hypothetical protein